MLFNKALNESIQYLSGHDKEKMPFLFSSILQLLAHL